MPSIQATSRVDAAARLSRALWSLARFVEQIDDPELYQGVQAELVELEQIELEFKS